MRAALKVGHHQEKMAPHIGHPLVQMKDAINLTKQGGMVCIIPFEYTEVQEIDAEKDLAKKLDQMELRFQKHGRP